MLKMKSNKGQEDVLSLITRPNRQQRICERRSGKNRR